VSEELSNINYWIEKLKQAGSPEEVFQIVDQFRPLEWTDAQRAAISKLYIKMLDMMQNKTFVSAAKRADTKNGADEAEEDTGFLGDDGPVWYEKI
jgi:hypothetical protein